MVLGGGDRRLVPEAGVLSGVGGGVYLFRLVICSWVGSALVGMDAVEVPLPVAKLVATDGSGVSVPRFSSGGGDGDSGVFGGLKISFGCGSLHKDTRYPTASTKCNSASRNKSDGPDSVLLCTKNERNGKRHCTEETQSSVLSSPKHECQQTQKKSMKRLGSNPSSKRPRKDQPENPMSPGFVSCSSSDKSRAFRQKNVIDGKRCDKKNFKVAGKSKFDSFIPKNGQASSDSSCGKNILGIYGLKADFHNVTRDVDDLSLSELLDGSYKCPSPFQDKGKRGQTANDGIVLSVRKAYLLLLFHGSTDSPGKRNIPSCPLNLSSSLTCANDCDGEAKCIEETLPSSEEREIPRKSQLYLPKDMLKRLKLPIAPDLDSLLHDTSMISSSSLHGVSGTENVLSASLPQFSWSLCHSGVSKPSTDTSKFISNRNTCQSKWVRIGSIPNSNLDVGSCFTELDQMVHIHNGDPSKQQKCNNLLQDVRSLTMDFSLPCYRTPKEPCVLTDTIESRSLDDEISFMGFGGLRLNDSLDPNPLGVGKISSDNYQMCGYKGFMYRKKEADSSMQYHENCLPNPSSSNFRFCGNTHSKEKSAGVSHGCLKTSSFLKNSDGWKQLPTYKIPKLVANPVGLCPQLMAAAKVLCELTRHTDFSRKWNRSSGKIKWHDTDSQMTVKANKSRPPPGNTDRFFMEARSSSTIRTKGQTLSKHLPVTSSKKSKVSCVNNVGRGHISWSAASAETTIPVKQLLKNPAREMDSALLPIRIEKGSDIHRDFRKGTVIASSYAVAGACDKGLSRGQSKRM